MGLVAHTDNVKSEGFTRCMVLFKRAGVCINQDITGLRCDRMLIQMGHNGTISINDTSVFVFNSLMVLTEKLFEELSVYW